MVDTHLIVSAQMSVSYIRWPFYSEYVAFAQCRNETSNTDDDDIHSVPEYKKSFPEG